MGEYGRVTGDYGRLREDKGDYGRIREEIRESTGGLRENTGGYGRLREEMTGEYAKIEAKFI